MQAGGGRREGVDQTLFCFFFIGRDDATVCCRYITLTHVQNIESVVTGQAPKNWVPVAVHHLRPRLRTYKTAQTMFHVCRSGQACQPRPMAVFCFVFCRPRPSFINIYFGLKMLPGTSVVLPVVRCSRRFTLIAFHGWFPISLRLVSQPRLENGKAT